jgi:hypothetical protein
LDNEETWSVSKKGKSKVQRKLSFLRGNKDVKEEKEGKDKLQIMRD